MTIQDFIIEGKRRFEAELRDLGIENYVITSEERVKDNDVRLYGLNICEEESDCGATVYFDDLYHRCLEGDDWEDLMDEFVYRCMYTASFPRPPVSTSVDELELDSIKDKLSVKLFDTVQNKSYLAGKPYIDVGCGLALIAIINAEPSIDSEWGITVTLDLLDSIGCDKGTLLTEALENTMRIAPPVLARLQDIHEECRPWESTDDLLRKYNLLAEDAVREIRENDSYVLTNEQGWLGASALFYPGVMQTLYDILGDYYVIPSSRHELIIIANKDMDVRGMQRVLAQGNMIIVSMEDLLSYNIFRYDPDIEALKIA